MILIAYLINWMSYIYMKKVTWDLYDSFWNTHLNTILLHIYHQWIGSLRFLCFEHMTYLLWGLAMFLVLGICSRKWFSVSLFGGGLVEGGPYAGWGSADPCFFTRPSITRILNFRGSVPLLFGMDQHIVELWITTLSNLLNDIVYQLEPSFCLSK